MPDSGGRFPKGLPDEASVPASNARLQALFWRLRSGSLTGSVADLVGIGGGTLI